MLGKRDNFSTQLPHVTHPGPLCKSLCNRLTDSFKDEFCGYSQPTSLIIRKGIAFKDLQGGFHKDFFLKCFPNLSALGEMIANLTFGIYIFHL